ncbi:nucleotide-diphospho-sugar transferase [Halteromyces radiatus]|uniref:nucleotide-diphospho-sugar transferase n=1 Tax=Halteromyces radiatus TaxID=101107 RepID=UPI0022208EBE|nr:nucleotide-diphospho-sugar transferase [Halteromyces radiatus]KAI8097258.1 nucleotide-diphospho-sugar transferase [Halteromyces radiatus]
MHDQQIPLDAWTQKEVRGALYMIVRNENLPDARATIRVIQDRFNDKAKYPWVLLNNQYFNADFKRHVSSITTPKNVSVYFGKIDTDAWAYPSWVDVPRAENALWDLFGVARGESLSHHQLLRYQAGLFFYHPLFDNVEYTWRVEPGAMYTCELDFDPFKMMKAGKKKLESFMQQHPEWIKPRNQTIMPWITHRNKENTKDEYNFCHMWSNFEIADLSFYRSEAYRYYFDHLDSTGGFFYEKWGDPVRTLAAAMFLDRNEVYFFDQIGYTKDGISHCPLQSGYLQKCTCDSADSHDMLENSCTLDLLRYSDPPTFDALMNYARTKLPPQLSLDLNNTDILKQVIKKKDQLEAFIKDQERRHLAVE